MIFGSFGFLVIAVALLITAVVKSSVAIGVGSLVCTGLAIGCLVAANAYYRKATGGGVSHLDTLRRPAGPGATVPTAMMPAYMPMVPQMAMAGGGNLNGSRVHSDAAAPPISDFDSLSESKAIASIGLLNLEELHALRRFEIEHDARSDVLAAIDTRITSLVELRRTLES